jgi:hypothetical protein
VDDLTIIDAEQVEYLPAKTLLRLGERAQAANKNLKAFKQVVSLKPDLFRGLEDMDIEPSFSLDNEYVVVSFAGDGETLGKVWGLFRRNGYQTHSRPAKGDTMFYAFWDCAGHAQLFMNFSSTLCKRVQVGTEMKEVPVYKTQCGELDLTALPTESTAVAVVEECPF